MGEKRQKRKILLAEDSRVMRNVLRGGLVDLDVEIVEAENGAVALEAFEPGEFVAVVTDWNMPMKNGMDLVRGIREVDRDVPIIIVTAESSKIGLRLSLEVGATDYMTKPVDLALFNQKIRRVLSGMSSADSGQRWDGAELVT